MHLPKSLSNRQTNAQQGVRGRANHPLAAPPAAFSFVPSTARFLFGGTKRKCGVGTVGSGKCHALTDRGQYAPSTRNGYLLYACFFSAGACGAVLSTDGKYPKVAGAFRCAPVPWRLLKRRRARNKVHLGKQPVKQFYLNNIELF